MDFNWKRFTKKYEDLVNEIEKELFKIKKDLQEQFGYSLIEKIHSRIKSEESIIKKLDKKNLKLSLKNLGEIKDIAGIRIICKFLDDIPEIITFLKETNKFEIIKEKDFISNPKKSGYRSKHLICKKNELFFEIQLRTLAMDFWATNEHLLKYKFKEKIPEDIKKELKEIAEESFKLDQKVNKIRKEIKIGSITSRIVEQLFKGIYILEDLGLNNKASFYRKQIIKNKDNLNELKKLSLKIKSDVPKHKWN